MPIILSAPHGGRDPVPGVPERKGIGVDRFRNKSDFNTDLLVGKLADAIEKKLGKRLYTVIARFHRKYVDANRASHNAYESEQAKSNYDAYHLALAKAHHDVMERWGEVSCSTFTDRPQNRKRCSEAHRTVRRQLT